MHRKSRRTVLLGALSVVAFVAAAACSKADDSDDGTAVETQGSGAEGTSSSGTTGDGTAPQTAPGETHVTHDEGEPVKGGTLVYGIEADTANPWAPYRASTATAGYVMITAVSDPLFYATAEGDIAPMLVEKWEHNKDYTEWTYHIREGITFHDGTPLDGAAVKFNLETCQYAPLTAAAMTPIKTIESTGQTVTIKTRGPYVVLPRLTTERQCAYMFSPKWLASLEDVPQRQQGTPVYDAKLAATPANGNPARPVGLGAFKFESYQPGNGNGFRLVRNDDYWRGPNGVTGEDLPYLDAIEGVVAVDIDSRANSLRSGQFDIIHTSNPDSISEFLDDDGFETTASSYFGDTNYIMLNVAEGKDIDPKGANADSPLLNVHCRRALAYATDQERLIEERSAGLSSVANGPFGPGMLGYLEDTGYPSYDPDKAVEEFETCLSELGTDKVEFTFNTTNDPFNVETNTLMISMWQEVLGAGIDATITPIEQGQYIGLALTGDFNAFGWRNHGGIDPATQAYWWESQSAAPIGELALNFGRFRDKQIDDALQVLQTNPDPAARKQAAEDVNRRFGEQVYNLWTSWALWAIISQPYVNGVEANVLPDGGEGVGLAFSGRHMMNQMWCDEGSCE